METLLKTDHYKFTMAEAGWPFRKETFYYSHRKGGPHLLPFDPVEEIKKLNPFYMKRKYDFICPAEDAIKHTLFLDHRNGTRFGGWIKALDKNHFDFEVKSVGKGSWVQDREPFFTVTGPSFAVSWLEPLILQWNYRIQIATLAAMNSDILKQECKKVTCQEQANIINETLEQVRGLGYSVPNIEISIANQEYVDSVRSRCELLVKAVEDSNRIFEVGMRGATCLEQHLSTLKAAKDAGIKATSNSYGAYFHFLKSVGTMGHEHIQRFGSDKAAFRAMVERVPGSVFFLVDTFDTKLSGIPNAFEIIKEQPERNHAIRFDSGDIESQFRYAIDLANKMDIDPIYCLEDGWNLDKTIKFENIRKELDLSPEKVLYGYGGHIVKSSFTVLNRDRVAAVWKITQSGENPTMKFGSSDAGKQSLPGMLNMIYGRGGMTYIVQEEELNKFPAENSSEYVDVFKERLTLPFTRHSLKSEKTSLLIKKLKNDRDIMLKGINNA